MYVTPSQIVNLYKDYLRYLGLDRPFEVNTLAAWLRNEHIEPTPDLLGAIGTCRLSMHKYCLRFNHLGVYDKYGCMQAEFCEGSQNIRLIDHSIDLRYSRYSRDLTAVRYPSRLEAWKAVCCGVSGLEVQTLPNYRPEDEL